MAALVTRAVASGETIPSSRAEMNDAVFMTHLSTIPIDAGHVIGSSWS